MILPAPIPLHLLAVAAVRRWLHAGAWAAVAVRWAAVPLALWVGGATWSVALCLGAASVAIMGSRMLRPRSVAAPLFEESVFLIACGMACATPLLPAEALTAAALGMGTAVGGLGIAAGLLFGTWGRAPEFVQMRRPRFRVLGDNPDSLTLVCRAWSDEQGWVIDVPPGEDGPVTIAATQLATLSVAGILSCERLDPVLSRGSARIGFGASDHADVDLGFVVPTGRYVVAVRYYRPRAGQPLPVMRRG